MQVKVKESEIKKLGDPKIRNPAGHTQKWINSNQPQDFQCGQVLRPMSLLHYRVLLSPTSGVIRFFCLTGSISRSLGDFVT